MKDINKVIELLKSKHISQSEYAQGIGTSRQNVSNWTTSKDGIPKRFIYPTFLFIREHIDKKFKCCDLLKLQDNNSNKESNTSSIQE